MPERAYNGDTSFDAFTKNHEQGEHNFNGGRLSQLHRLIKIGKLNCCSLIEDDVPSEPHLPQIPDRRQHKPFNGVCVLPNMPGVDALIQEFEANYTDRPSMVEKKNAVAAAEAKGIFVKRIIEMYETKNGRTNSWPLGGRQANAKATVEDKQRPTRSNLFGTVQTSKKAEKREFADATDTTTANSVSRQVDARVERNDDKDDDEEKNDPEDIVRPSELTAVVPHLHVNTSSSKKGKRKTKEKDKGKSSRQLRGFLCKFNRSGPKHVTRRCRVVFPRQDEFWRAKRNSRIFLEPPLSEDFISKRDNVARASSPCAAGDNSCDADDHDVLEVAESQDDSGNSYKNLQIDMFDFKNEGPWSETRDSESDDESLSIKSVDQFLPSLDNRRLDSFDEIAEMTYLASSSFEDENNANDQVNGYDGNTNMATGLLVFADESAKNCLEQSTKIKDGYSNQETKLQQIFARKKLRQILSLFNMKRCFQKKTMGATGKAKYNWRLLRKSQKPTLSPDSGFGEQSVSTISPSTLPTSLFSSEKSACNDYHESTLTFKTFRPRDSFPREGISRSKRRLVLNELSPEKFANGQDEPSCAILDAQTKTSHCDLFPASSSPSFKGSTSLTSSPRSRISSSRLLKYSYLSQKIPRSTFLSLTRVDELSEQLDEQLDVSELQPEYSTSLNVLNGWMSSSPYQNYNEPRWRSTPTLPSFFKESSCYFYEPIGRERSRIPHAYRDAKRSVPIFGTGSLFNITGSSCFATVKPRNWRPYMRPENSRSFERNDGIKRRSSV